MVRTIGRRALFFLAATLVCVALVPATPSDLRWVDWVTAGIGALWTVALSLEDLLSPRREGRVPRPTIESSTPFGPPPRPGAAARSDA